MTLNKTIVVDIHKINGRRPKFDEYIGRKLPSFMDPDNITYNSKWANPHLDLDEYEIYIRKKIKDNPSYYNLEELRNKRLGCWCITTDKIYPLVCHGQVLIKLIREKDI